MPSRCCTRAGTAVRILPGMSASGMHWRVAVTTTRDPEDGFRYSTGSRFEVGEQRVDGTTTVDELADHILEFLPDEGIGEDAGYARWYGDLMEIVRRQGMLRSRMPTTRLAPEWESAGGAA